ncbi:MAG: hypothetical protein Q9219_002445 [cf. Caloplaca sp. 3 TL-2023]
MQNPLRRPRGNSGPRRDVERGVSRSDDDGVMSKGVRGHFVAMSGEFVGTVMFLYFSFGATQIANNILPPSQASLDRLMFISLAFGFSLATTAWVFYRVSGGLFNPAVTLGLVLAGGLPPVRGALLFFPQMLGGMVAAALVSLFIEMFLTAELMLTVLFLAAEKSKATFVAPVAIGLALFVAELTGMTQPSVFFPGSNSFQAFITLVVPSILQDRSARMSQTDNSMGDENDEHLSKKIKGESLASGPRLVFKNPALSTLPRKPLQEIDKPVAEGNAINLNCSYNVLWRKPTGKKNKTWEGDALLSVDFDGFAELRDRETGSSLGKARCNQPLLPGSTLLISGKDVEVDSVLSKAQLVQWKQSLKVHKPTEAVPPERQTLMKNRTIPPEAKKSQDRIDSSVKPTAKSKSSLKATSSIAATGREERDPSGFKNAATSVHKGRILSPLPRHNPHALDAIVMKRPPDANVDVVVDPLLAKSLRDHQREGVKFMYDCVMGLRDYNGHGVVLADAMGLGKTLQTIALLWTLLRQSPSGSGSVIKKALIICPATVIDNWKKEFRKWLGLDRIGVLVADTKSRVRDFTHGKSYSIMIVGYEKLRNIQAELSKGQAIDLIVADEAHRLKTAKNKSAQAIRTFPTERRIFLTGTPVQNDLSEFYFLVDTVNPGILGSYKAFTRDLEIPINRGRQPGASAEDIEQGEECNRELLQLTSPFILRRTAEVLAKYLPARTEHVLFCRPTEPQKALYRHLLASPAFSAAVLGNAECSLQLITLLKKACNSPALLKPKRGPEKVPGTQPNVSALVCDIPPHLFSNNAGSTKLRMLDQLLHNIRTTTSEKVVLVSNYTTTLDLLDQLLTSVGHRFARIDGSTPSGKRQGIIDDFNRVSAEHCFAFLLSAKTGGVGINLIGASRLVLFDVDWNPATDLQAMARIHRDGQKRECFIYRFLMAGGMDEKIWQRQIVKLGLAGNIMDHKEETSSFTREDLKDLFRLDETSSCQTHDLIRCSCGGQGGEFVDIDDYADPEAFPTLSALTEASTSDIEQKAATVKTAAHAARDALMAYTHVDTSKFAEETGDNQANLILDEVLLKTLQDEGNTVSFVFSKTST